MWRQAILLLLGAMAACRPPATTDEEEAAPFECVEEELVVEFAASTSAYEQVHLAVTDLQGTYEHEAQWLGEAEPTMVTTTVVFEGDSYQLQVLDQYPACPIILHVPVRLTVETGDGRLLFDESVGWGQSGLTQPFSQLEDIRIGAMVTTSGQDASWLDMAVHATWPDVADPTDDAELVLEVSKDGGKLEGLLFYSKRVIFDETTVFYTDTTLLEWGDT